MYTVGGRGRRERKGRAQGEREREDGVDSE